jgi:hypothetical protein
LVIVPLLIRPGAPHYVKGLLSATLFMKIPIYAVCVSYSNHAHGIEPMATVLGATLVPLVLTFGAAWTVVTEAMREPAKVVTAKRYSFGEPARPQTAPDTHRTEGATLRAAGANPVREGI